MTHQPRYEAYLSRRRPEGGLTLEDIAAFLSELVRTDPRNALPEGDNSPIWDEPLVKIAAADDSLFETLKQPGVVGPIHVSPDYWLPGAKAVISFFVPFSEAVKDSYDKHSKLPSLEWVSSRQNGEVFLNVMRRGLQRYIEVRGGRAVVPNLDVRYTSKNWLPMWSERHVGFVAGLGSFGLHDGLLTEKGAAGRIGSVVTDIAVAPTPRAYTEIYEYCLWKTEGRCGACIKRCPVQAIDANGKKHTVCITNGDRNIRPAFKEWGYHSCGHCQSHLPCSHRLPRRLQAPDSQRAPVA